MKQYFIFIVLFILMVNASNAQNLQINEEEKILSTWQKKLHDFYAPDIFLLGAIVDSSITINNAHPIKFYQTKIIDLHPINQLIERYVCLPEIESDSIEIKFTCRSKNLIKAHLIINTIDSLEHLIKADTINTLTNNKWVTFKRKIHKKDISFLDLIIRALGKPEYNQVQSFWIDKLEILDNNNVSIDDEEKIPISKSIPDIKKKDYISFNPINPNFNQLEDLKKHKIIALGESMHGSESINQLASNLIQHQVKNNNCKLILFEIPLEMSLSINQYIQGNESIKLDSLKEMLFQMNCSDTIILEFFLWLKDYNAKHPKNKVSFLGTDLSLTEELTLNTLIKYMKDVYQTNNNSILKKLVGNLKGTHRGDIPLTSSQNLDFRRKLKNTLSYLHKYKTYITSKLGKKEYILLEHCLQRNIDMGWLSFRNRLIMRDVLMFPNVKFFIDNLINTNQQASVVIYSHQMHVNRVSNSFKSWRNLSMGKLLSEKYKDDYFVIGILAAKGNIYYAFDKNKYIKEVIAPEENTIEKIFLDKKERLVYFDISKIKVSPIKMRYIGYPYKNIQFFEMSPQGRVDAIFYLEESKIY